MMAEPGSGMGQGFLPLAALDTTDNADYSSTDHVTHLVNQAEPDILAIGLEIEAWLH